MTRELNDPSNLPRTPWPVPPAASAPTVRKGPGSRTKKRGSEIAADAYLYHDWSRLIGTPVEIRKDFTIVRVGIVDDAMPDSSALWLAADSTHGRAIFAAAEGYQVWIRPQELTGKLCYKMAAAQLAHRQLPKRP
jgi:hypothetical protein